MAKRIRKVVKLGKQLAGKAADRVKHEIKAVIKAGSLNKGETRKLVRGVIAELRQETERLAGFAKQELKREMKKAKPLMKRAVQRWKKARKR